jgi:hypothetical protein
MVAVRFPQAEQSDGQTPGFKQTNELELLDVKATVELLELDVNS